MRIVIDARCVADHFPGIGRYVYNLLQGLAELQLSHTFIVLYNPALQNTRHDITMLARFRTIELVETSARPFTLAEQLLVPRLVRQLRADLYHAPYYVRPYLGLHCPSVTTVYDAIPHLYPGEVSRSARVLFDTLMRLSAQVSQRLIAISSSARTDISTIYHIPAERIDVTLLAAAAHFSPQSDERIAEIRHKHDLPEDYVLSVGSNKPHKNVPQLVDAWSQLPGSLRDRVKLVIAGHWDARYPEVKRRIATGDLFDSVRLMPYIADQDLPALYSGALFFVHPSRYEGFGLPPLEAMSCGAPVLCGNTSSLPEVVGNAALIVDTSSTSALKEGLARLLSDTPLRSKLHAAALRQAAAFSWHKTAQATLSSYERAAAR